MSEESVFDSEFRKYFEKGFNVHPIAPGTKVPGRWNPQTQKVEFMTGWADPSRGLIRPPQPGCYIGILLGPQPNGINLVAIDWDDDEIATAALEKFPAAITKWGRRGFTAFYRSAKPIPSRKFSIGDRGIADLLSVGKQTVLPPSIHPEERRPYVWEKYSLTDVSANELPEIGRMSAEITIREIEEFLRGFGWKSEPPKSEPAKRDFVDKHGEVNDGEDSFCKSLNRKLLDNLDLWVPKLKYVGELRRTPTGIYRGKGADQPPLSGPGGMLV
jgi:hypothetical protein